MNKLLKLGLGFTAVVSAYVAGITNGFEISSTSILISSSLMAMSGFMMFVVIED